MNILLADDEPLARARLRRLLEDIPGARLIGEADNGRALLDQVSQLKPDVVLLDIHMPGLDGLQTAEQLNRLAVPPAVVFITAYGEHALTAFETAASGYLLKPVGREQLAEVLKQCQRPRQAQLVSMTSGSEPANLLLRRGQRQLRIPVPDIICCLADQKLTRIVHRQGEDLSELSLQELEGLLGPTFLRVHRSALVARTQIRSLDNSRPQAQLQLADYAATIPVSRRRLPSLRRLLRGRH